MELKSGTKLDLPAAMAVSSDGFVKKASRIPWASLVEAEKVKMLSGEGLHFADAELPAEDRLESLLHEVQKVKMTQRVEVVHLWSRLLEWGLCRGSSQACILPPHAAGMEHHPFLESFSAKVKGARSVVVPICAAEHWAVLIIDGDVGEVKAMDSLNGDMSDAIVASMKSAMFNVAGVPGWSWLASKGVGEPERCNLQRQGHMECAFFVCHWMETEARRCEGQGPWSKGARDVKVIRAQLVKLLDALLPMEKKLQERMAAAAAIVPPPRTSSCSSPSWRAFAWWRYGWGGHGVPRLKLRQCGGLGRCSGDNAE